MAASESLRSQIARPLSPRRRPVLPPSRSRARLTAPPCSWMATRTYRAAPPPPTMAASPLSFTSGSTASEGFRLADDDFHFFSRQHLMHTSTQSCKRNMWARAGLRLTLVLRPLRLGTSCVLSPV